MTSQESPALVTAAKNGNLSKVKDLLEQGYPLNARDKNGATALYWACCRGYDKVSDCLIKAGCSLTAQVKWGTTALMGAADNGHAVCATQLLSRYQGVDVNTCNGRGDTALHAAAYRGHLDILKLLTDIEADPFIKNSMSLTAIQEAAAQRHEACVRHLTRYMETYGRPKAFSLPVTTSASGQLPLTSGETLVSWPISTEMIIYRQSLQSSSLSSHAQGDEINATDISHNVGLSVFPSNSVEVVAKPFSSQRAVQSTKLTYETGPRGFSFTPESCLYSMSSYTPLPTPVAISDLPVPPPPRVISQREVLLDSREETSVRDAFVIPVKSDTSIDINRLQQKSQSRARPDYESLQEPPPLPPRSRVYKHNDQQLYFAETAAHHQSVSSCGQSCLAASPDPSGTGSQSRLEQLRRIPSRKNHRLSSVPVGEFVEQLQFQLIELQDKTVKCEHLIADLQQQIAKLQVENSSLKRDNSRLIRILQARKTANLPENDHLTDSSLLDKPKAKPSESESRLWAQNIDRDDDGAITDNTSCMSRGDDKDIQKRIHKFSEFQSSDSLEMPYFTYLPEPVGDDNGDTRRTHSPRLEQYSQTIQGCHPAHYAGPHSKSHSHQILRCRGPASGVQRILDKDELREEEDTITPDHLAQVDTAIKEVDIVCVHHQLVPRGPFS